MTRFSALLIAGNLLFFSSIALADHGGERFGDDRHYSSYPDRHHHNHADRRQHSRHQRHQRHHRHWSQHRRGHHGYARRHRHDWYFSVGHAYPGPRIAIVYQPQSYRLDRHRHD